MIAYDGERRPLLLLPLTLSHAHGVAPPASWAASTPPSTWRCGTGDFAASATPGDLEALIAAIGAKSEADVLALCQQPLRWRELANPMALLPHQASANDCPLLTIVAGRAAGSADLAIRSGAG